MRPAAKIRKLSLLINRDVSILQIIDKVELIHIVLKELKRLGLWHLASDDLLAFLAALLHFLFNGLEYLIIYGNIPKIHVIVKAFLYDRAYPEFCIRIKALYRLSHNMRA